MNYTLTMHSSHKKGSAKHNDRSFDHYPKPAEAENRYLNWTKENISFEEAEYKFYENHFAKHIEEVNAKAVKARHKERIIDVNKYLHALKSRPEEVIIEVGDKNNHVDKEKLREVYNEYLRWHRGRFPQVKLLDAAFHLDEATPHFHERRVYIYQNENGVEEVNQGKCLKAAGLSLPDPTKPISSKNNYKMTYSKICREAMIYICKNHGISIKKEAARSIKEENLDKKDYLKMLDSKIEEKKYELADLAKKKAVYDKMLSPEKFVEDYLEKHNTKKEYLSSKYNMLGSYEKLEANNPWEKHLRKEAESIFKAEAREKAKELGW